MPSEGDERGPWPDEERRTEDARDIGRRRRITDVDPSPTVRDVERALAAHELEARVWRARHDERIKQAEEQADYNRELLDGMLKAVNKMSGTLETVERYCLKIDGQTKPAGKWDKAVSLGITLLIATLPVLAAYLAFKGQVAQLTQGAK